MVKVRAVCNWLMFNEQHKLAERIIGQCTDETNFDPGIEFVNDDNYDFLVVFNALNRAFIPKVEKKRILGFIQEPPLISFGFDKKLGEQCRRVYTCASKRYYPFNDNFISAPSVMFYLLDGKQSVYRNNHNFAKPKKLSYCVSSINGPGLYTFRHHLLKLILESDLDCDIYGRGLDISDSRYKGSPENKADALLPYEFSIGIENSVFDGYISEKLFDCFLCNTVPLYVGSPTVDSVYNPHSLVMIPYPDQPEKIIGWLKELVNTPPGYNLKYRELVTASKERYFKNYNIYNLIRDFVYNSD